MSQLITQVKFPFNEFPNSKVNVLSLQTEVNDKNLSVSLSGVPVLVGSEVVCSFVGDLTPTDFSELQEVVSAHSGADFGSTVYSVESQEESSTSEINVWHNKLSLHTDPLKPGTYLIAWSCETRVGIGEPVEKPVVKEETAEVLAEKDLARSPWVQTRLRWDSNEVVDTWNLTYPHHFGGVFTQQVDAGRELDFDLDWKKLGVLLGSAKIRQAKLYVIKQ
jgi:hypothetical protein